MSDGYQSDPIVYESEADRHARILREGYIECRMNGLTARFPMAPSRRGEAVSSTKPLRQWLKSVKRLKPPTS